MFCVVNRDPLDSSICLEKPMFLESTGLCGRPVSEVIPRGSRPGHRSAPQSCPGGGGPDRDLRTKVVHTKVANERKTGPGIVVPPHFPSKVPSREFLCADAPGRRPRRVRPSCPPGVTRDRRRGLPPSRGLGVPLRENGPGYPREGRSWLFH